MTHSVRGLFVLIALFALPLFGGDNRWTINGPNGGNARFAFDPVSASIVFAATDNGILRSTDGGVRFGSAGSGIPAATSITTLVVDPQNTDTAYASLL